MGRLTIGIVSKGLAKPIPMPIAMLCHPVSSMTAIISKPEDDNDRLTSPHPISGGRSPRIVHSQVLRIREEDLRIGEVADEGWNRDRTAGLRFGTCRQRNSVWQTVGS
ncbi:hypothetical protein HPP92_002107 [Vanilla planifolia]|uniref:Uncharacterized protein n=1 Tax=Vanilla planifolia TaxID=51239 RepID=A0A835RZS9_VANPL|nr:hypothetical protein HPP92_002346 [Vanilla planifolia]KAG0502035.1 hypothetical protein HPP92_002107 [Vanilla planifolia]